MIRRDKSLKPRLTILFGAIFAGALLLAACGDADNPGVTVPEGSTPAGDAPEDTAPPETAPPETAPPETAPPETNPPDDAAPPDSTAPEEPVDDGDSDSKILIALLIGAALVGVVAIVASLMGRDKTVAPAPQAAPTAPSPKRQLLGNVQWLHDQLSLELLTGSAEQAAQRWSSERVRVDNMAIQAQQIAAEGADTVTWQQLAGSISGLSSSLNTAIGLRSDEEADPTLVREAVEVVNRKRRGLLPLINAAAQGA
ncbi:MAG: hypothetical protein ACC652_07795 [Acidimicrobiales bacterium]